MVSYGAFTATTGSGVIADTTAKVNARMLERGGGRMIHEADDSAVRVQPDERVTLAWDFVLMVDNATFRQ